MANLGIPRVRASFLPRLIFVVAVTLGTISHSPSAGAAAGPVDRQILLQEQLDKVVADYDLPGVTAALVMPDDQVHALASGLADIELERPMLPDTRIMSGSTGKIFAAAVVLSLVQDGALELEAPISTWLGRTSEFSSLPSYEDITLRMLLNHSSGLSDYVYDEAFWAVAKQKLKDPRYKFTSEELVSFAYDKESLFPPGTGYSYTDIGYLLLGLIVEEVSDLTYYELLQQRFIYPLDLRHTGPSRGRIFSGLAQGYIDPSNPILGSVGTTLDEGVFRLNTESEWTGGGLVTNSADLARWLKLLVEGRTVLGQMPVTFMTDHAVDTGEDRRYGPGLSISQTEFGPMYAHGGWFMGYRSFVGYFPSCAVAVAIQTNTEKLEVSVSELLRDVFGETLSLEGCESEN